MRAKQNASHFLFGYFHAKTHVFCVLHRDSLINDDIHNI
jgi:hypothetical protein